MSKIFLLLLRISMGWLMFYAGITKILNPDWSSAGYLKTAATFPELYQWFLQPNVLPVINFVNEWGLTLLGISLMLGLFVRLAAPLGALLMIFYYFPILKFPYIAPHSFLVDEHIIYALVLIFLAAIRSGEIFGLDKIFKKK